MFRLLTEALPMIEFAIANGKLLYPQITCPSKNAGLVPDAAPRLTSSITELKKTA